MVARGLWRHSDWLWVTTMEQDRVGGWCVFPGRAGAGAAETSTLGGHKGRVHIFFPWLWLRFGLHACLISCCLVCGAHTLGGMQQVSDAKAV